jgi:hypothetical protein
MVTRGLQVDLACNPIQIKGRVKLAVPTAACTNFPDNAINLSSTTSRRLFLQLRFNFKHSASWICTASINHRYQ